MRGKTIILSTCAIFALGITAGRSGECTTQIEDLSKTISMSDAGSGPTGRTAGSQHPPTAAMTEADRSSSASRSAAEAGKQQHPPTDTMNTTTSGAAPSDTARGREQHPPTAIMNKATEPSAASPRDVWRQTQGLPTAAGQAPNATGSEKPDRTAAMTALDQARALDREGKEAECMAAIREARRHIAH